jgi:hypothetical protein
MFQRLNMVFRKNGVCALKHVKPNASKKKLIAKKWNRSELNFARGG